MKNKVLEYKYNPLIKQIRKYFLEANNSIWDKRNKIKIISFLDNTIAIKSFKIPHIINKIAYTFIRDSKAKRSYENSIKIGKYAPKPIGYAEFKKFGLLHDSYFLCEQYRYDFTIREPLKQKNFKDRKNIFNQFAVFTHALHQKGVEHLDYSPGNILIKELQDGEYEFKIIDVNRMRFKKFTPKEGLENFSKLWADDKDLTTIVKAYVPFIQMDEDEAINIALQASQKHKDKKMFKQKMFKHIKRKKIYQRSQKDKEFILSKISVAMMAKNADDTIDEVLDALQAFDEVLLYLNDSTDRTKSIAQKYENVNIVEGEFLGFGQSKNEAAKLSKHDWILSLDSDEVLSKALVDEISQQDFSDIHKLYKLKRDNYFLGHKTQNSNLIVRIYNKNYTKFDDCLVHEKIIVPKKSQLITLKHSIKHLFILDINQTLTKIIQYTDLGSDGKKTCYFVVVIAKSIYAFLKTYLLQGNILKGWVGYALAVNSANKRHYKYIKQYINCQKEKNKVKR